MPFHNGYYRAFVSRKKVKTKSYTDLHFAMGSIFAIFGSFLLQVLFFPFLKTQENRIEYLLSAIKRKRWFFLVTCFIE